MIATLGGGVGGSRFLHSLCLAGQEEITAIINTGDDIEKFGLHISPDIDINIYTLAGVIHRQGWGFQDETYACQSILSECYGEDCWFNLGDKDLATHLYRTSLLKNNKSLSEITQAMCDKWAVPVKMIPMSDDPVKTYIETPEGTFHIQEYLIKRKMSDQVMNIYFEGADNAKPAPGILEAVKKAEAIFICPSNPLVSVGPILAIPGVKRAIAESDAKVVAVSPLIGGKAVKGPLARMMNDLGLEATPCGIADCYDGLLDGIVIDEQDQHYRAALERKHVKVMVTNLMMDTHDKKRSLGKNAVRFAKDEVLL